MTPQLAAHAEQRAGCRAQRLRCGKEKIGCPLGQTALRPSTQATAVVLASAALTSVVVVAVAVAVAVSATQTHDRQKKAQQWATWVVCGIADQSDPTTQHERWEHGVHAPPPPA